METHKSKKKRTLKNPWIISTIILIALSLILIIGNSNIGTKKISEEEAGELLISFYESQGIDNLKVDSIEKEEEFYKVNINYQGQIIPFYVTQDGYLVGNSIISLLENNSPNNQNTNVQTQEIPKQDIPKVELFVMSHCPYGTQMEKGIIPVARTLKDKIDFEIKFVNYAMHPSQGEVEEELNQYCIQRDYNEKYLDYLSKFLEEGNSQDAFNFIGISEADIQDCVKETDAKFNIMQNLEDESSWSGGRFPKFMIHDSENQEYGVQGSPTLVVNGVKVQSNRDAQSLLNTICNSFTNAPEECNQDMSSFGIPSPGFGYESQGGSASSAGCAI